MSTTVETMTSLPSRNVPTAIWIAERHLHRQKYIDSVADDILRWYNVMIFVPEDLSTEHREILSNAFKRESFEVLDPVDIVEGGDDYKDYRIRIVPISTRRRTEQNREYEKVSDYDPDTQYVSLWKELVKTPRAVDLYSKMEGQSKL